MKKSKVIVNISLILLAVLISALLEIFVFNGVKLYNMGDSKGTFSLLDKAEIETRTVKKEVLEKRVNEDLFSTDVEVEEDLDNDETKYEDKQLNILKVKFDKMYVDRITIQYKTDVDFELPISVKTFNVYGDPNSDSSANGYMAFLKDFNSVTRVIDGDADEIELILDYNDDINFEIKDIKIINEYCFNVYRFILISIFLITIVLLVILRKIVFVHIEWLFVILSLCMGVSLILITPCLTKYSWDDHIHLNSAYTLFESGKIKTSKAFDYSSNIRLSVDSTPKSYQDMNSIHSYLNKNTNVFGEEIVNSSKYISYSNYSYIPSAIIIGICRLLKIPYTILFYLGKLANLLVYILIMFYAIKNAKIGKKLLFVLALLPSIIFLASQYSKDAIITAGIYLAVSTFLNCYCTDEKMGRKNLAIFIVSIIVASLSKMIYVPMLLLLLILPKDKFVNEKNAKWIKILTIVLILVAMSTFILPTVSVAPGVASDIRGGNSSTGSQLQVIKEQPISFARMFSKFTINEISTQFFNSQTLSRWCNFTRVDGLNYVVLLITIILCAMCSSKEEKIEKIDMKLRITLFALVAFITCLICGSMYLSFTTVGQATISGIQSRYYIPLLFSFYIVFKQRGIKNGFKDEKETKIISIILVYIYFLMLYNGILMAVGA